MTNFPGKELFHHTERRNGMVYTVTEDEHGNCMSIAGVPDRGQPEQWREFSLLPVFDSPEQRALDSEWSATVNGLWQHTDDGSRTKLLSIET